MSRSRFTKHYHRAMHTMAQKHHYSSDNSAYFPSIDELKWAAEHGMTLEAYADAQTAEMQYKKQIADETAAKYAK